jgi:hypothetical protein
VEAGDVEVAEARDGPVEMREQHAGHPAKRGGLVPPEHTGATVAGMRDLDGEGVIALEIVTAVTVARSSTRCIESRPGDLARNGGQAGARPWRRSRILMRA